MYICLPYTVRDQVVGFQLTVFNLGSSGAEFALFLLNFFLRSFFIIKPKKEPQNKHLGLVCTVRMKRIHSLRILNKNSIHAAYRYRLSSVQAAIW